jgi:hypothetical protein
LENWHGTTILGVKKGGKTVIAGDGQVSMGNTVMKPNAKKVRRIGDGKVIGGFAGATADAFTLFERLEKKLEQYNGQLLRAAVELAKDWRTDKYRDLSPSDMYAPPPAGITPQRWANYLRALWAEGRLSECLDRFAKRPANRGQGQPPTSPQGREGNCG